MRKHTHLSEPYVTLADAAIVDFTEVVHCTDHQELQPETIALMVLASRCLERLEPELVYTIAHQARNYLTCVLSETTEDGTCK